MIKLIKYFLFSIISTVVDTALVWICLNYFSIAIVVANTIGVVIGFIIHYLLSSKNVFETDYGPAGFLIYLGTFFIGLALADGIIYICYNYLILFLPKATAFLIGKGFSIAIPFFIMYFLRLLAYRKLLERRDAK